MNSFTDWIDPKDRKQCGWAIKYLSKIPHVVFEHPHLCDQITKIEMAFDSVPTRQQKERRRLMKVAWSQQKLKSDGKISCQYRLHKESVKSLKSIAKKNKANLNVTIEELIDKEQKKVIKQRKSQEAINRQVSNIADEKIAKAEEKSQKSIDKLNEEVDKLKTILHQTLIDNYQSIARLVSKEQHGKLSEEAALFIKNKATKTMLKKGIIIPESRKEKPHKQEKIILSISDINIDLEN